MLSGDRVGGAPAQAENIHNEIDIRIVVVKRLKTVLPGIFA
jgi:hypothetical protein